MGRGTMQTSKAEDILYGHLGPRGSAPVNKDFKSFQEFIFSLKKLQGVNLIVDQQFIEDVSGAPDGAVMAERLQKLLGSASSESIPVSIVGTQRTYENASQVSKEDEIIVSSGIVGDDFWVFATDIEPL